MSRYINKPVAAVALTTIILVAGCATTGRDLVRDNTVQIEKVSSKWGLVTAVSVIREGVDVTLRGEVRRRPAGRGPIPGHVDVEFLDSEGVTRKRMNIDYRRPGIKSRYAKYHVRLRSMPPSGSAIRVMHHAAGPHALHVGDMP